MFTFVNIVFLLDLEVNFENISNIQQFNAIGLSLVLSVHIFRYYT